MVVVVVGTLKFEEDIQRMLWKIKIEELNFKTSAESVRLLLLDALEFTQSLLGWSVVIQ